MILFKRICLYSAIAIYGFSLAGCTFFMPSQSFYFPIDENNKMGLIDKDIERWISQSDEKRIKLFIATAAPTATIQWRTRLIQYTLESHAIFVDEFGRPCRCYTLARKPLIGRTYTTREIAYRDIDAQWKRKQSVSPLPLNAFAIKTILYEH